MLIYEKKVEDERKLFGTMGNIPSEDDVELTYKDVEGAEITPVEGDTYLDNKAGGMFRKSDEKEIEVFLGDVKIIGAKDSDSEDDSDDEEPGEDPETPDDSDDDHEDIDPEDPTEHVNVELITDISEKNFVAGGDFVEFMFKTVANDDAGVTAVVSSDFGSKYEDKLAALEYEYNGSWINMKGQTFGSGDGFPLADAQSNFRAKFTADAAGQYTFSIKLTGKATDGTEAVLASVDADFEVAAPEVVVPTVEEIVADANAYEYSPKYTYKGESIVEGNTLKYTISAANLGNDYSNIMNDFARFIGAIYRSAENKEAVSTVTFGGVDYTWDVTGTLKGSNYKNGETSLVSAVVAAMGPALQTVGEASEELTVAGEVMVMSAKILA